MNKKSKKTKKTICVVLIIVLILLAGGSYFIGDQLVEASTQLVTNEQTMEMYEQSWKLEGFDYDTFKEKYEIKTVTLTSSFDEHTLPFDVVTKEGNENIVVMSHGMLGNRLTNYPTAEIFLENGYNVITYDQRSSGENYAERSTFGYWEKYDLIDCINYAAENFKGAKIAVWGESFGGITALLAVGYEDVQDHISVLILDCPVSEMKAMIESEVSKMGIPIPMGYMMACGDLAMKQKLGFSFDDADGLAAAAKITVPTMIFNSSVDEITPESMGQDIYNSLASEKKELWTSDRSDHIEIRNDDREIYTEKILDFIL